MSSEKETRCYVGEVRAEVGEENKPTHIVGLGSVFDSRSELIYGFREIIKPGAFDDVLNDDVRGLFNHDPNYILGRTTAGTLSLSVNERGLVYDITGVVIREITRFSRLYDVSPVTYPAYQDADSAVRSMNAWKEARDSGDLQKAINQKLARERLMTLLNA